MVWRTVVTIVAGTPARDWLFVTGAALERGREGPRGDLTNEL